MEIVKENRLSNKVVVLHDRIEVCALIGLFYLPSQMPKVEIISIIHSSLKHYIVVVSSPSLKALH
jgi:hypothetical protein